MNLHVSRCHAWAPGLSTADDWRAWAKGKLQPEGSAVPSAKAVPAMLRRRLTLWGRMALETASACADEVSAQTPVLFSSRHGDLQRTLRLLQDLAGEEPLSPTAFSLSVHNASLGIYTIVHQALGPSLALAAGKESLAESLVEAWTLLEDGAEQVLLVHTDDRMPEFYRPYADERDMPLSLALLLNKARGQELSLSFKPSGAPASEDSMAQCFLRWWFAERNELVYPGSRLTWTWTNDSENKIHG